MQTFIEKLEPDFEKHTMVGSGKDIWQ
jgi:hypothetical protein